MHGCIANSSGCMYTLLDGNHLPSIVCSCSFGFELLMKTRTVVAQIKTPSVWRERSVMASLPGQSSIISLDLAIFLNSSLMYNSTSQVIVSVTEDQ